MRKLVSGQLVFSPTDLIRFLESPFASWMDRYYLEYPDSAVPDEESEEERLIAETGDEHEQAVLFDLKSSDPELVEVPKHDFAVAREETITALKSHAATIYQAALEHGRFAGYADFLLLDDAGRYQVWDSKLARSPKPYYAIQLCCYSEMLAAMTDGVLPERFGIILGTREKVEFRVEDFIHYYRHVKSAFLALQDGFTGVLRDRPEPLPRANHGRWSSHAEQYFVDSDHLVRVAGITVGQIRKLKDAGVFTMADLASFVVAYVRPRCRHT